MFEKNGGSPSNLRKRRLTSKGVSRGVYPLPKLKEEIPYKEGRGKKKRNLFLVRERDVLGGLKRKKRRWA